jgi:branched-chain amino acid transport system substrate-binding protein
MPHAPDRSLSPRGNGNEKLKEESAMRPKLHSYAHALLGAILVAALCFTPPAGAAEAVLVGVAHRADYAYAEMMKNAFEMAREKINADGGIKGRPLELRFADDQGRYEAGERAIKTLIREKGAVMLVGGYSSSNTLNMAFVANRLDTPFIVCTAADDHITQHNLVNVFRLNPPASEYTKALEAFFLEKVKPTSISIVYENSPYGTGGARRMMAFCRSNEIALNSIHPYFKDAASPDYIERVLSPMRDNPPDVIFMVSYLKDAALLVQKANEMQLSSLLSGGAGGFTHEAFSRLAGPASEHLVTATLWSTSGQNPLARQFRDAFVKQHSLEPDYHAAEAYSALLVAADALRRASSMTAGEIRAALGETNLMTPFGRIEFKDYGLYMRQNEAETQVFQIQNGRFETIWPPELATSAYAPPLE